MSYPPEAFMIFKEELAKAKLEKERLKKEYENKTQELNHDLRELKERIGSQQQMLEAAWTYAGKLEEKLKQFESRVQEDDERNRFGYH